MKRALVSALLVVMMLTSAMALPLAVMVQQTPAEESWLSQAWLSLSQVLRPVHASNATDIEAGDSVLNGTEPAQDSPESRSR